MEDPRCCGTGTCIINEDGLCWCGQRWDGTRMCFPEPVHSRQAGEDRSNASQPSVNADSKDDPG